MGLTRETKRLAVGMATHLLGPERFERRRARDAAGRTAAEDAIYGYSVWLRHLVTAHQQGLDTAPDTVVELGPADSLGVGIAALLSGARTYRALDVLPYDLTERNLEMFDDIVGLFQDRAPIPDGEWFADVHPRPPDLRFPHHVLTPERLERTLQPDRLRWIEAALRQVGSPASSSGAIIAFTPAWDDPSIVPVGSVDLVLSQAVMEHVTDLPGTYASMAAWLAPGGAVSQCVDFRSHDLYETWNGHLAVPSWRWRAMWGRREPLLNRSYPSLHARLLRSNGLEIVFEERIQGGPGLPRSELAREFRHLEDDDLATSVATFQARKPDPTGVGRQRSTR